MALRQRVETCVLPITQYADEPRDFLEVRELEQEDVSSAYKRSFFSFVLMSNINSDKVRSLILTDF